MSKKKEKLLQRIVDFAVTVRLFMELRQHVYATTAEDIAAHYRVPVHVAKQALDYLEKRSIVGRICPPQWFYGTGQHLRHVWPRVLRHGFQLRSNRPPENT